MSKEIPRRLRRFYRKDKKPAPKEPREEARHALRHAAHDMALSEVRAFEQRNKRMPLEKEADKMAEKLFKQLKRNARQIQREKRKASEEPEKKEAKGKTKTRRHHRPQKEAAETAPAPKEKTAPEKNPKKIEKEQLAGFDLLEDVELDVGTLALNGDENVSATSTGTKKCPTCGAKADEAVFCPHCGAAFCTHCAAGAKREEDEVRYTCPKCQKAFKARNPAK